MEAATELGYPFGHWVRFALLTLQRGRQEIAAMRREDLARSADVGNSRLRIKTKNRISSTCPGQLATCSQSIEPFPDSELVFTSTGAKPIGGFSKAKQHSTRLL